MGGWNNAGSCLSGWVELCGELPEWVGGIISRVTLVGGWNNVGSYLSGWAE